MHTKRIAIIAIIAALPFTAMAENISGAMYTAPAQYDNNHPAPTTNAYAPYGRINIDTDDQEHIATTAYVKGAYNSTIAAVNRSFEILADTDANLLQAINDSTPYIVVHNPGISEEEYEDIDFEIAQSLDNINDAHKLVNGLAVKNAIDDVNDSIAAKRVEIYTTWDTNDKTQVAFVNASSQSGQ